MIKKNKMREVRILLTVITAVVLLIGCEKENDKVDSTIQVSGIQFIPNYSPAMAKQS
jgi:hypothetical protein